MLFTLCLALAFVRTAAVVQEATPPDAGCRGETCHAASAEVLRRDHAFIQHSAVHVRHSQQEEACHTAEDGEECFRHVLWAMGFGIHRRPEWYGNLTVTSSFEDFQLHLNRHSFWNCSKPCPETPCESVTEEHPCYPHVKWARDVGIDSYPDWYPGLTNTSTFEEFQQHLYAGRHWGCPRPCVLPVTTTTAAATTTTTLGRDDDMGQLIRMCQNLWYQPFPMPERPSCTCEEEYEFSSEGGAYCQWGCDSAWEEYEQKKQNLEWAMENINSVVAECCLEAVCGWDNPNDEVTPCMEQCSPNMTTGRW